MRHYEFISLKYFKESGLIEYEIITEILETTMVEVKKLITQFQQINSPQQFDPEEMYFNFHKFKPTAIMYELQCRNWFELYGTKNNKLDYEVFIAEKDSIIQNLESALMDIQKELSILNSQN